MLQYIINLIGGVTMCDTMVCLPSVTKSGKMIFAKNSDRGPNEPQILERIPAKDHDILAEPELQATYIKVRQVKHTYAVTLMKPSWIWGAEMGFNEHGINIGNEAVFTKVKKGPEALIGMDLLRLALERSKTAIDAMVCITELLEQYGQGGNCGYQKDFFYDNSYLIADSKEAYVLETAGKFWAAVKVKDIYTISNGLTIGSDFDYAHPEVLADRENNPKFSFAKKFKEPLFTHFSQSKGRRLCSLSILREQIGNITVETLMDVLRSHAAEEDKASVGSVCMHAGGRIGDHTTGSYIAEYGDDYNLYYVTGASLPCLSIYKPLLYSETKGECRGKGISYWENRELLTRYFLSGQADKAEFKADRVKLEEEMLDAVHSAESEKDIKKIIPEITSKEQELINKYLKPLKGTEHSFTLGKSYYRKYWTKKTIKLKEDLKLN